MYDLPSPAYTAAGYYRWTSSLLFLDKPPSSQFLDFWTRLHRKLEIHKMRDGAELIDFDGSARRQTILELQLWQQDERLEFLHWLSMDAHEYVHGFDFFTSGFGFKVLRQRMFQVYEILKALAGDIIRIPILKAVDERSTVQAFRRKYLDMQGLTNVLFGTGLDVGSEVPGSSLGGVGAFLPKGMPSWEIPLPAFRVRSRNGEEKLVPITTKHILEARAVLVQLAAIEALTTQQFAHEYWNDLQKRSVLDGFYAADNPFLEYTAVIAFLHTVLGKVTQMDSELYFNILDLCLQVDHESRDIWDLHPPTVLVNVVSEFISKTPDPDNRTSEGFGRFLDTSATAPNRNRLAAQRRERMQRSIGVPCEHFIDELFQNQVRTELEFLSAREKVAEACLSPRRFHAELASPGSALPKLPLAIARTADFSRLAVYTDTNGLDNRLFLLQHILTDLLNEHEVHCPYKEYTGICPLSCEECGTHREFHRTENEACLFGLMLINLGVADKIEKEVK